MIEGQSSPRWDKQTLASALLIRRTQLGGEKLLTGLHVCSTSLTKGPCLPLGGTGGGGGMAARGEDGEGG